VDAVTSEAPADGDASLSQEGGAEVPVEQESP